MSTFRTLVVAALFSIAAASDQTGRFCDQSRTRDNSKCRENGGSDNDCCTCTGTGSCADGF